MKSTSLLVLAALSLMSGCYSCGEALGYPLSVSGKITRLGKRMHAKGESVEERVAITLKPYKAEETNRPSISSIGEGADGLSLDCVSTRCAGLEIGQCINLACRRDWRAWEPDVIECKLSKTVECEK